MVWALASDIWRHGFHVIQGLIGIGLAWEVEMVLMGLSDAILCTPNKKIQIYMFLDIIGIWLTLTINLPIKKDYPNKDILIIFDVWSFSSYTCLLTNWIWNELVFFYNHTLILLLSLFFISEICNRRLFSAYFFNLCAAA